MKKLFSSFRNRIFLSFGICFVGIMLFILASIQVTSEKFFSEMAITSTRRELASSTDNLASTLQHTIDYSISVSINDIVINTVKMNPSVPNDEIRQYEVRKKLNSTIGTIIGLSPNIKMWDIMALDGNMFMAGGYDLSHLAGFSENKIFALHEQTISAQISGPYYQIAGNPETSERKYYFVISKPVVDLNTRDIFGYVLFFLEDSVLASPFVNYRPQDSEVIFYISDEDDQVLLATDKEDIGKSVKEVLPLLSEKENEEKFRVDQYLIGSEKEKQGRRVVYCQTQMMKPKWQMIHVLSMDELLEEQKVFEKIFIGVIILMFLAFFFLSWWNAKAITKPILNLSAIMKNVVKEAYETTEVPKASEEICILYEGYNSLVQQTQELLQTIYEDQKEKNEYQFKLVQAQVKPHFLYNTLEMIKSMIDLGMNKEAGEAISAMALFYRHSLSKGSDIVTIKEEIEMAEQYLYIERLRHMEYFDYEVKMSAETENYIVPKLILQPVLENTLVHGSFSDGRMCFVTLKVESLIDTVKISIRDNGKGMTEQKQKELENELERFQTTRDGSFGLLSINRRIRLMFGSEYGIHITSTEGKGTEVVLIVPKMKHFEEQITGMFKGEEM